MSRQTMQFRTPVETSHAESAIDLDTPIVTIGSCFSDEVGARLARDGFNVAVNPLGVLYNPASIHAALEASANDTGSDDLFTDAAGVWHSWLHSSAFSSPDADMCRTRIAEARERSHTMLSQPGATLIVTLGTAFVFRLAASGQIVANCHKMPQNIFNRQRLTVDDAAAALQAIVNLYPHCRIIFTVSPIRHRADGLHGNNLSKSILLLAVDRVVSDNAERTAYFPAYEAVVDDLRDYRFYAADMLHPSAVAADYVYNLFCDTYMTESTLTRALDNRRHAMQAAHRQIIK